MKNGIFYCLKPCFSFSDQNTTLDYNPLVYVLTDSGIVLRAAARRRRTLASRPAVVATACNASAWEGSAGGRAGGGSRAHVVRESATSSFRRCSGCQNPGRRGATSVVVGGVIVTRGGGGHVDGSGGDNWRSAHSATLRVIITFRVNVCVRSYNARVSCAYIIIVYGPRIVFLTRARASLLFGGGAHTSIACVLSPSRAPRPRLHHSVPTAYRQRVAGRSRRGLATSAFHHLHRRRAVARVRVPVVPAVVSSVIISHALARAQCRLLCIVGSVLCTAVVARSFSPDPGRWNAVRRRPPPDFRVFLFRHFEQALAQ